MEESLLMMITVVVAVEVRDEELTEVVGTVPVAMVVVTVGEEVLGKGTLPLILKLMAFPIFAIIL